VGKRGTDLLDCDGRIAGSAIGGDENIRCLAIAFAALKTRTSPTWVVVCDIDAIGRTGPNPRLVVVIVAREGANPRAEAAVGHDHRVRVNGYIPQLRDQHS